MKGYRDKGFEEISAPLRVEEIERQLATERLGKTLHYFPEIDSTNNYARNLAEQGAMEGEVVIAESQTRGKGRLGRSWVSPAGRNLYLSVILRPKLSPLHAPQITLMSAVALAETIQSFIPFPPEIKWPNDILVGGKKVAGILTESACAADRVLFVVLGIGVNVNFPREEMPVSIRDTATSLMTLSGAPVDRTALALQLIRSLNRCYGDLERLGFPPMAERWAGFFRLQGKRVKVEMMDQAVQGKAIGIDGDGALILEDETGTRRRIIAGDVIPLEP
ncbi:MAG: biotin--[acetyl-CoA-carboxylase] ligase [Deltaproteobacteria bacterium]|nr:biotin--[acetyl-CoA-carboxylase] ligase [Deltaproteobacteria bacterium]